MPDLAGGQTPTSFNDSGQKLPKTLLSLSRPQFVIPWLCWLTAATTPTITLLLRSPQSLRTDKPQSSSGIGWWTSSMLAMHSWHAANRYWLNFLQPLRTKGTAGRTASPQCKLMSRPSAAHIRLEGSVCMHKVMEERPSRKHQCQWPAYF